ncbi:MAG: uncharacterized protein QG557_785 [Pseudomonadota bacterium]|nr:uncharacterized protein [Pseudomonadota bacterium]
MTPTQQTELEAAAFRRLIAHLKAHSDVQNIDLMLTADFCRNCLAKWYLACAQEKQIEITYDQARDIVYGMPYEEWKTAYQTQATPEQLAAYQAKLDAKKES